MISDRKYFLKPIGSSDWLLDDDWITARPELLKEVRSPKLPSAIGRGDFLVLYATGKKQIFAIARSKIDGAEAEIRANAEEARWPYVIPIQILLAVPQLPLAPDWSVMGIKPQTIMRKPYIEITRTSYEAAWEALTSRTKPPSSISSA